MVYVAAFSLAFIVLIGTIIYLCGEGKNHIRAVSVCTALMLLIIFIPFNQHDVVSGFLRNIYRTFQVFGADAELRTVQELLADQSMGSLSVEGAEAAFLSEIAALYSESIFHSITFLPSPETAAKTFLEIYNFVLTLLFCAAPLSLAGFVLTFSRRARSKMLWFFSSSEETWFFTKPSEKALQFVKNLSSENRKKISCVFCNVKEDDYTRVTESGAIPFENDVSSLGVYSLYKRPAAVFFMSDLEEDNIEDYLRFAEAFGKRKLGIFRPKMIVRRFFSWKPDLSLYKKAHSFHFFVSQWFDYISAKDPVIAYIFSRRPEAALLLDSANSQKTGIICRRVSDPRSIIYREFIENRGLFEPENRESHILLVGCGFIGSEILKTLLWIYAWPGRKLCIDVVDSGEASRMFSVECPGLFETGKVTGAVQLLGPSVYSSRRGEWAGHSIYYEFAMENSSSDPYSLRINFYDKHEIQTFDITRLPDADSITQVFVSAGDDASNLQYAIYLRRMFKRMQIAKNEHIMKDNNSRSLPKIVVALANTGSYMLTDKESGMNYDIDALGGENGLYTIDNLLNPSAEQLAARIHLAYLINEKAKKISDQTTSETGNIKTSALKYLEPYYKASEVQNIRQWHSLIRGYPDPFSEFYANDYNIQSSLSRSVFNKIHDKKEITPETEHLRWHVFMLTEGFQYNENVENGKDFIAKLHTKMTSYNNIAAEDRKKDQKFQELIEGVMRNTLFKNQQ